MNAKHDYYEALGVAPSADAIVIRAAFRALAQRYHPDKWSGPAPEGSRRMAMLNEAYAVLSDPEKRKSYDERRKSAGAESTWDGSDGAVDGRAEDAPGVHDAEWQVAVVYAPELERHYRSLRRTSYRLASVYRQLILITKDFNRCGEVAAELEGSFFRAHFGTAEEITQFARSLLARKDKIRLRALNRASAVLGGAFDPYRIILPLHYEILPAVARDRIRDILAVTAKPNRRWLLDTEVLPLVNALGGTIEKAEESRSKGAVWAIFPFCKKQFPSRSYLNAWVWDSLRPTLMKLTGLG